MPHPSCFNKVCRWIALSQWCWTRLTGVAGNCSDCSTREVKCSILDENDDREKLLHTCRAVLMASLHCSIWSGCDCELWSLMLKTLSAVPTHMMNICVKFHWSHSTKYGDATSCKTGVNGQQPDGQTDDGQTDSLNTYCLCHKLFMMEAGKKSFHVTFSAVLWFEWPDQKAGLEIISVMRTCLLVNLVTLFSYSYS